MLPDGAYRIVPPLTTPLAPIVRTYRPNSVKQSARSPATGTVRVTVFDVEFAPCETDWICKYAVDGLCGAPEQTQPAREVGTQALRTG